ncbi:hypothetical protein [Streptomyces sp. NPDC006691]|uniref:hypothetical protein n=1 Tax=Streptomyces sp. NPDC006691 TaxID=3364757 RepID=UPI00368648FC
MNSVTYVGNGEKLSVSFTYRCAAGTATQVHITVAEDTPELTAEEKQDLGAKGRRDGWNNDDAVCDDTDHTGTMLVTGDTLFWHHPGGGSAGIHLVNGGSNWPTYWERFTW